MTPSDRDPHAEGGTDEKSQNQLSFVQRLKRHFGDEVDPEINLQAPEDSGLHGGRDAGSGSSSRKTGSSRELVDRLTDQLQLGSRYQIKGEIARGGMGTVLCIWDDDLRRKLAMKVMHGREGAGETDESEVDQERLGRFLEEAQITSQLDHPGIVPVHDLGIDDDGRCYFTMRLVRGIELKEALDQARDGTEEMTRTKILGWILKVCEAMAYAHSKGVVHRDLKPSNIMVGRFGETYVMDWGLARVLGRNDSHDLRLKSSPQEVTAISLVKTVRRDESEANPDSPLVTMDGDVVGTPCYMAPEQAQGRLEEVGPQADVYSLGAILYYMLSGKAPYVAEGERISPHTVLTRVLHGPPAPVAKLAKDQPDELIAICEKAMQRDQTKRYAGMLEVADDVEAFLENRVVGAYEVGSIAEIRKWMHRNRGMAAAFAGMFLLTAVAAVFYLVLKERQVEKLEFEKGQTAAAKVQAETNERRALESERHAIEKEKEALAQREEANRNAELALKKSEEAQRSEYVANVLSADFSLMLHDLDEADERLNACDANLRGWEWEHLKIKADAPIAKFEHLIGGVHQLAFDRKLGRVVALLGNGQVRFLDAEGHDLAEGPKISLGIAVAVTSLLKNLDMSLADGARLLALVGRDENVRVFDVDDGDPRFVFPRDGEPIFHGRRASSVAFSPDERLLASGAGDGGVIVWNLEEGKAEVRLSGHHSRITDLAWSPDGEMLASSSVDGTVYLWNAAIGMGQHALSGHSGMAVNEIAWGADGNTLYTAGEDQTIGVWAAILGKRQRTLTGHVQAVRTLAYDDRHQRLVSGSALGTLRVWNADGTSATLRGHTDPVRTVIFYPDGDRILSGSNAGDLYVTDPTGDLSCTELPRLHGEHDIESVAFSPSGRRFVTASKDKDIILWDALSGEPLRRLRGHTSQVNTAVFSPDGNFVVSGAHDKTARLWDAKTGRALRVYPVGDKWCEAVGVTRDGTRIIAGAGDRKVRVYDLETSELLVELTGHRTQINSIAVSSDGRHFASAGANVLIWDLQNLESGEPRMTLTSSRSYVRSIAFHPDGTHLIAGRTGRSRGVLELWDIRELSDSEESVVEGRLLQSTDDQSSWISAVAYSPDGRRIISGSGDGTLGVRDGESGETLLLLGQPLGRVEALAVSPDSRRILAAGANGTMRIWEAGGNEGRLARREARLDYLARTKAAQPLVDELFLKHFLVDEVMVRIQSDLTVAPEIRATALRLALMRGDDPQLLYSASLEEALMPLDEKLLPRALSRSEAALGLTIEEPDSRVSLVAGISRYRNGLFPQAAEALQQAGKLNRAARRKFAAREEAWRYLFLAMSLHRQGRGADAKSTLQSFRRWMDGQSDYGLASELQPLIDEVESLLGGAATGV